MKKQEYAGNPKFRLLRTWGLVLLCLAAVCLAILVMNGCLLLTRDGGISPLYWVGFFACLTILILSLALSFLFFSKRSKMKIEQLSASSYFSEPTFVYSESAFVRESKRLSEAGGKKGAPGYVASLNIKGLNADLLTFYGNDEVKAINSIAFESIHARFGDKKKYRFGFSMLNSFLIYAKTDDVDSFEKDLLSLASDVENKVVARGKISNLTLLFGIASLKEDSLKDAVSHALFASRFNASNRFASAVIPFSKDQMDVSDSEKELPSDIIKAIKEEQFQIFYQPKFNLRTNRFYGAEALVRWSHPTRGLLPPSFFIPFSEKSGLIVDLDHYIYEHTIKDISRWEAAGEPLVKMSINLSRRTVYNDGLILFLKDTAARYGVESKWVDIEITESLAARDAAFLYQLVSKIKSLGMSTSIDDFGVGYSSFNSLKKLPFDTLKIDKSFIDDIEVDAKSRDIVKAVIDLAHSMGMWTIAEGVETAKQVAILKSMGLDAVQGYYYSRPLNGFEFQRFLKSNPFEQPLKKGEKK